jgi:uncharacterized lipoprotein
MMKTLIIGILSVGALTACSTTPSHPSPTRTALAPGRCSANAGPPALPGGCTSEVRSYSSKDLRQTGMVNAAQALQMLDPAISAHGP